MRIHTTYREYILWCVYILNAISYSMYIHDTLPSYVRCHRMCIWCDVKLLYITEYSWYSCKVFHTIMTPARDRADMDANWASAPRVYRIYSINYGDSNWVVYQLCCFKCAYFAVYVCACLCLPTCACLLAYINVCTYVCAFACVDVWEKY